MPRERHGRNPRRPRQGGRQPGISDRTALVRRARRINRELALMYPDAHTELDFTTPLELLVATILSAQTTDKRVNMVDAGAVRAATGRRPTTRRPTARRSRRSSSRPGFFRAKTTSRHRARPGAVRPVRRRGAAQAATTWSPCRASAARPPTWCSATRSGCPGITVDTHFGRLARRFGWTTPRRPGQGRAGGRRAVPALGVDDAVAPADLARPAGLPRPPAGLRRLRDGRGSARRSATAPPTQRWRGQAGQAGAVLVTPATPAGAAPPWLNTLAGNAQRMTVPPLLRPPVSGTRPAVGGADAVRRDRPPGPICCSSSAARGCGATRASPRFPAAPSTRPTTARSGPPCARPPRRPGVDPAGVDVLAVLPGAVHLPQRFQRHPGARLVAHTGAGDHRRRRGGHGGGADPASPIWPIPPTGSGSGTRPAQRARRSAYTACSSGGSPPSWWTCCWRSAAGSGPGTRGTRKTSRPMSWSPRPGADARVPAAVGVGTGFVTLWWRSHDINVMITIGPGVLDWAAFALTAAMSCFV